MHRYSLCACISIQCQAEPFNSHVVPSGLIAPDNSLIKKRCPGIQMSVPTYPALLFFSLRLTLFIAPLQWTRLSQLSACSALISDLLHAKSFLFHQL